MSLLEIRHEKMKMVLQGVPPHHYVDWLSPLVADVNVPGGMRTLCEIANEYLENAHDNNYLNVTPNGMMMPKAENVHIYNEFAVEFFYQLHRLHILDKFAAWNVPAIRYKEGELKKENLARPRASEYAHSDEWLGWDSSAVVFMIPLAGDVEHNGVRFFRHELDESWIKPQESFNTPAAQRMVRKASPLPWSYEVGHLYPNDISVLHQTQRTSDCGWRLSAEVVGYLYPPSPESFGASTAFSAGVAWKILCGESEFKARLCMGEVGDYTETGRALDLYIA